MNPITPADIDKRCTAEQLEQLLARHAARERDALITELQRDLAVVQRIEQQRAQRAAQEARRARGTPSAQPSALDDVAVLVPDKNRGLDLGGVVLFGRKLHYLTRELFDGLAVGWQGRHGEDLFARRLVICQQQHPDLRTMIATGFSDPLHDARAGRARHSWELEHDSHRIDTFLREVVNTTDDRETLAGWLAAAGDAPHARVIQERYDSLFAALEPGYWGGKDDRQRGPSASAFHHHVGSKG